MVRAELTQYVVPGWGVGELWTSDALVLAHELRFGADAHGDEEDDLSPPNGGCDAPSSTVPRNAQHVGNGSVSPSQLRSSGILDAGELAARFHRYLAGDDVPLDDVPIDLAWATPFQCAVAAELRRIPRGEVVSYGELAALAGYSGAARAAGTFCARNRFMLILPCHRVVGASDIGGYGPAGVGIKRRLLALEGIVL